MFASHCTLSARRSIKKGIDAEVGRRRRDDTRIQIRKAKREEGLQKRRAMKSQTVQSTVITSNSSAPSTSSNNTVSKAYGINDIPMLIGMLQNTDTSADEVLTAVQGFRKMLSVEQCPPVQEVLNSGAVPMFVKLLESNNTKVQFEAAWALTNVASTDFTRAVVDYGAVPMLVHLLLSADANVREQCAWCLGNIAGDSSDLRDFVLQHGGLNPL